MSSLEGFEKISKEANYKRAYFFYRDAVFVVVVVTRENYLTDRIETSIVDLTCIAYSDLFTILGHDAEMYLTKHKEDLLSNAGRLLAIIPKYHENDIYLYEDGGVIKRYEFSSKSAPRLLYDERESNAAVYYEIARNLIGNKCYTYRAFIQKIEREHKGISLNAALEYLRNNPDEFTQGLKNYDITDPIISISKPTISREADNNNKDTFDFISVEILLRSDLDIPDIASYIKANLVDFDDRVREKISENKAYQKYGVPVDFLTLYGIATRGTSCIEFRYELRKLKGEIEK